MVAHGDEADIENPPSFEVSFQDNTLYKKEPFDFGSGTFSYHQGLKRQDRSRKAMIKLRAIVKFKCAASGADNTPPEGFGVSIKQLVRMVQNRDHDVLNGLGGVNGLAKALRTNRSKGIRPDKATVQRHQQAYGVNIYSRKPRKSFRCFVWDAAKDRTFVILMICAVVSLAAEVPTDPREGWYDGVSIAAAVCIVIFVTAFSDYRQSLQEKRNIKLEVVRGGKRLIISIFDLVVGDIVRLNKGDQILADGILVSGYSMLIDETSMTGESEPVQADAKNPFLLSGCKVVEGYGSMLVTGVGLKTEWGRVIVTLEDSVEEAFPQDEIATLIGKIGLSFAFIVFSTLFIRYFVLDFRHASGKDKRFSVVLRHVLDDVSVAITVVVVAVPEGSPLAVTLTLANCMRRMMMDKSLVGLDVYIYIVCRYLEWRQNERNLQARQRTSFLN